MRTEREQLAPSQIDRPSQSLNAIARLYDKTLGRLYWQVWAVLLVLVAGGIGFGATSWLLTLPKAPNCPKIFWPVASASMRIYCAQLEADKGTVEGFLGAINLVEALSKNHPLRAEIDGNVEEWAVAILDLAEQEYNAGNLETAIATARKIPNRVKAYGVVEERIGEWQSTWSEGEAIFAEVQNRLRASEWNMAFREAVKLLYLDNQYWSTTRYTEITKEIQVAQEESRKLDSAYVAMRRGGIENWLKAVEEADRVNPNSYAYNEAQKLIAKAKNKIVEHVEGVIDRRDWQALLYVTDRLPESVGLKEQADEWQIVASAGADSQIGTTESLESAIVTAQEIKPSSPYYQLSQELIGTWKLEIKDVAILEKAQEYAQMGTIDDLNSAIAQAELIPPSNPRYQEARQEIGRWVAQVQTIEDQPILDRAEELSLGGTTLSLQQAIAQASVIGRHRALYDEAQERIGHWRGIIEEQEDRPFLDQAQSLASGKEYSAAIEAARQVRQGRSLYREARSNIRQWQEEIQAQKNYQEALVIAEAKTPEALIAAINILRKIPSSTNVSGESAQALNSWSYELLTMANNLADSSSLEDAIKLAKMVPSESSAYQSARSQIKLWRQRLNPTPIQQPVSPLLETNYPN